MKTVIEMAVQVWSAGDVYVGPSEKSLEHFAALVRADEREACAKIQFESILQAIRIEREACASECDEWIRNGSPLAEDIAASIRSRGETK